MKKLFCLKHDWEVTFVGNYNQVKVNKNYLRGCYKKTCKKCGKTKSFESAPHTGV